MNNIPALKPSLPVWVGMHGMYSDENANGVKDVARALVRSGMQVATVNWEEAAKDGILIQDARWTPAVGQWVAKQLIDAGFEPNLINGFGHSHGTYALYAMGERIMALTEGKQMNALVALDPAGNIPKLSGFDHRDIDFGRVSQSSVAIEGSPGLGSNALAGTADFAMHVAAPGTQNPIEEHSLTMTVFAEMLEQDIGCDSTFAKYLSLERIMNGTTGGERFVENCYGGIFEGIIEWVNPTLLRIRLPNGYERMIPLRCGA